MYSFWNQSLSNIYYIVYKNKRKIAGEIRKEGIVL